MKRQVILRGVIGIPIGISIGYLIPVFASLAWGQGYFSPCEPELVDIMGSEMHAVALQTALCALLGLVFGAGSVIWEIERWSLAKQTLLYFIVTAAVMLPTAYILRWMEHSLWGLLLYFAIYAGIFLLIWLCNYAAIRRNIRKMNEKLK